MVKHRKSACVCIAFCLAGAPVWAQAPAAAEVPKTLTLAAAEELLMQRSQAVAASKYQLEVSQALRQIAGYKPNPTAHVAGEQLPFYSPIGGSYPRFFNSSADIRRLVVAIRASSTAVPTPRRTLFTRRW